MKKWNMIIDVAECTNCQLCTLATMDEYVGNDWPGYTKPMPKHGHKWINILQKERGQTPMIDVAYVPTMCPAVHEGGAKGGRYQTPRRHRDHRSTKGKRAATARRRVPLWSHLVERGVAAASGVAVRRPSARSGLGTNARPAVMPDRRHA